MPRRSRATTNSWSDFPGTRASPRARVRRGLAELRLKVAEPAGESAAAETAKRVRARRSAPRRNSTPRRAPFSPPCSPRSPSGWPREPGQRLTATSIAEAQEILVAGPSGTSPAAEKPLERLGRIEASLALSRHEGRHRRRAAPRRSPRSTRRWRPTTSPRPTEPARPCLPPIPTSAATTSWPPRCCTSPRPSRRPSLGGQGGAGGKTRRGPAARHSAAGRSARSPAAAPETAGRVVFAAAGGAVYALDAAEGKVLWRKFVGWNLSGGGDGALPAPLDGTTRQRRGPGRRSHGDAPGEIQRVETATGRPAMAAADPIAVFRRSRRRRGPRPRGHPRRPRW